MIESAKDSRHFFLRVLLLWSVRFRTGSPPEQGSCMAASRSTREIAPVPIEIPARLRKVCFALCAMNLTLCLMAYLARVWIYDRNGLGIPTDFIGLSAAGRLALDGLAAQASDWEILKRIAVAQLGQDFAGIITWHYPPPFLFVASLLALLPYSLA